MTGEVLRHWKSMLSHPSLKEGTKAAVEMSIKTSENDLKIIRDQMKKIDNSRLVNNAPSTDAEKDG